MPLFLLEKTPEVFREKRKNSNTLSFSLLEPYQLVSSQTILKCIVQTIHIAYKNKKESNVKGHSTRALGPSYGLYSMVPQLNQLKKQQIGEKNLLFVNSI